MQITRWDHLFRHAGSSLTGLARTFFRHPGFAGRILAARTRFFFSRRLARPLPSPDGYLIETPGQLISYWAFFIELEDQMPEWVVPLQKETAPLVIDVGANAGLFTHLIWVLNPQAEIYSFEPLPKMAAKIREWLSRTKAKATLFNQAAAAQAGTASFYAANEDDTGASLINDGSGLKPITVPLVTLDSVVPNRPVFLLKIDVEGAECEVLAGAKQTIANSRFMLIEAIGDDALQKVVRALGPQWHHQATEGNDFLFTRRGPA